MIKLASLLAALSLTACGGSSKPTTTDSPATDGRAQAFKIGALEAWSVEDGTLEVPNDGTTLGVGAPPADVNAVLAASGLATDHLTLGIQCLLVKASGRVYLFDTGAGGASFAKGGHLTASLAKAGVKPADVTDIFISHAHSDHTYGLVANGALAFPNATIHLSQPELAQLPAMADEDPGTKALLPIITPKLAGFEPGAQITPDVKAVNTIGHTPGHSSYEIGTSADALLYLGDVAHHFVINVQKPAWNDAFDMDHDAANAMREKTLASLASSNERVFGVHFPYPGIGHVVTDGDHLVFKPE